MRLCRVFQQEAFKSNTDHLWEYSIYSTKSNWLLQLELGNLSRKIETQWVWVWRSPSCIYVADKQRVASLVPLTTTESSEKLGPSLFPPFLTGTAHSSISCHSVISRGRQPFLAMGHSGQAQVWVGPMLGPSYHHPRFFSQPLLPAACLWHGTGKLPVTQKPLPLNTTEAPAPWAGSSRSADKIQSVGHRLLTPELLSFFTLTQKKISNSRGAFH